MTEPRSIDFEPVPPMPADLIELAAELEPRITPAVVWPSPIPDPDQSREAWLAEVATARAMHDGTALEATRLSRELLGSAPVTVGKVSYAAIEVRAGTIAAKVYEPVGSARRGAVLVLHGGAYWMGGGAAGFDMNDELCRDLCDGADAVVVNADYRLAPEHPYPTPMEDAYRAFCWLVDNSGRYGFSPDRVVVLGISSGGNLATVIGQLAADRDDVMPCGQVLQAPSVDLTEGSGRFDPTSSDQLVRDGRRIIALYAGGGDVSQAPASPGLRADLAGQPEAVVIVGTYDPLAADARAYASRLAAAGVATTLLEYPMAHTLATAEVFRRNRADVVAHVLRLLT